MDLGKKVFNILARLGSETSCDNALPNRHSRRIIVIEDWHLQPTAHLVCAESCASFGLTGCKGVGSWKMPKMSWNREPSATTLAGTETPKLPESPATKYSPSTIASVGAGTTPGTTSGNRPDLWIRRQASPNTSTAATGLAAAANNIQSGPYTVGKNPSQPPRPTHQQHKHYGRWPPQPVWRIVCGVNTSRPSDVTLPNSVKGELANYPKPSNGTVPVSTASTGYGIPATQSSAYVSPNASLPPVPSASVPSASIPSPYASTTPSNPYQNLPPLPSTNAPSG